MANKPALGKGLASLLPGGLSGTMPASPAMSSPVAQATPTAIVAGGAATAASESMSNKDRHMGISLASLDDIVIGPFQPRREFKAEAIEELAQSIRSNGIIQPLVVRKTNEGYELIAGERRLRAAKAAGLKQVPIVIRRSTDREALELALIENIQRQDLNCVEEALAYFQLSQDFSLTQEEVAQRVGKDRATVANHLRLLRLPEEILEDLKKNALTLGHGKVLLSLEENESRLRARAEILEKGLSVRDAEALIESMKAQSSAPTAETEGSVDTGAEQPAPLVNRLKQLAMDLGRHWSTKVEVKGNDRKGKIVLHYYSREELDRLLDQMQNK